MGYIGAGPTRFNTADDLTVTGDAEFNGNLTVKGTTTTIDSASVQTIDLGDNDKIRLGDSDDLQIYHDGGQSVIRDFGYGHLRIQAGDLRLENADGTATYLSADNGAALYAYHNGNVKLTTTSTGVDVTGTVTADDVGINTTSTGYGKFTVQNTAGTGKVLLDSYQSVPTTENVMAIYADASNGYIESYNNGYKNIIIAGSGGNVGIGTSSPQAGYKLHVSGAIQAENESFSAGREDASKPAFNFHDDTDTGMFNIANADLGFSVGGTERMRIDSNGNVGIGTTSPSGNRLHVAAANAGNAFRVDNTTGNISSISQGSSSSTVNLQTTTNHVELVSYFDNGGKTWNQGNQLYLNNAHYATGTPHCRLVFNTSQGGYNNGGMIHAEGGGAYDAGKLVFSTGWDATGIPSERMRISGGNLLVGTTSTSLVSTSTETGAQIYDGGFIAAANDPVAYFNRITSDGDIAQFRKNGSAVGSIGVYGDRIYYGNTADSGISFYQFSLIPTNAGGLAVDNTYDCGHSGYRWDDVYATNGTIQTSDANEKQQIAALTDAEMTAAKAISALFKTYKWNSAVEAKGDAARTHTGVIAQDVEAAMTAAGLDAGDYAFFISNTWWETQTEVPAVEAVDAVYEDVVIPAVLDDDGNEVEAERTEQRTVTEAVEAVAAYTRTDTFKTAEEAPEGATERNRKGIRYPELLAFIGAATEQRLSNVETRLAALETA